MDFFGLALSKSSTGKDTSSNDLSGHKSGATGSKNKVLGDYGNANGLNNTVENSGGTANGYNNTSQGKNSQANGISTTSIGEASSANGIGTIATRRAQTVEGTYNVKDEEEKYLHIVGNGEYGKPSNAHTIDEEGNCWYAGTIYLGGTSQEDSFAIDLLAKIQELEERLAKYENSL